MRCEYSISITLDIDLANKGEREAAIELAKETAKHIYGPAVVMAKEPPVIRVYETSRQYGRRELPLFDFGAAENGGE